jgi:predicted membrane protein
MGSEFTQVRIITSSLNDDWQFGVHDVSILWSSQSAIIRKFSLYVVAKKWKRFILIQFPLYHCQHWSWASSVIYAAWNTPVCVHVNSQLLVRYNSHFSNEDRFKCLYLCNTSVENAAVFKIRKHFARKACLFNLRRKLHLIWAVVISCLCCIGRHWIKKILWMPIYIDLNCVCYETVYSFQRFLQYIWTSFV